MKKATVRTGKVKIGAKAKTLEARTSAAIDALRAVALQVQKSKARKVGVVRFELTGRESGDLSLRVDSKRRVTAKEGKPSGKPKIHIRGDGQQIRMVMEGKRDARKAFLAGKLRVRGDTRYLEALLVEIGLMTPGI